MKDLGWFMCGVFAGVFLVMASFELGYYGEIVWSEEVLCGTGQDDGYDLWPARLRHNNTTHEVEAICEMRDARYWNAWWRL